MSDAAAPAPAKNVTKPSKAAKPAEHPKYIVMVAAAIGSLKERGGSSRQAILKYVMANYNVGNDCEVAKINARVKTALKSGLTAGKLNQAKGTGATGSFRIGEKKEAAKTKPKKVMKPTAAVTKKPESPKKVAVKKLEYPTNKAAAVKPKKVKTPKKAATAKPKKVTTPKKAAVAKPKSPAKKAAKPKTQKKAAVSEKPAAKKAAKQ